MQYGEAFVQYMLTEWIVYSILITVTLAILPCEKKQLCSSCYQVAKLFYLYYYTMERLCSS